MPPHRALVRLQGDARAHANLLGRGPFVHRQLSGLLHRQRVVIGHGVRVESSCRRACSQRALQLRAQKLAHSPTEHGAGWESMVALRRVCVDVHPSTRASFGSTSGTRLHSLMNRSVSLRKHTTAGRSCQPLRSLRPATARSINRSPALVVLAKQYVPSDG